MTQFSHLIKTLSDGNSLSEEQLGSAMRAIINGEGDPVQVGAFLAVLHTRGEDHATLATAAEILLDAAVSVDVPEDNLLDTCGTGGDGVASFNISSAAAIVAAAAGAVVAKHGNRAVSSNCGSADLLEAAGVAVSLDATGVAQTLERVGISFLFAPNFHPALAKVAPVRKALGVRTIFNLLGPLVNPARPSYRIIGVFDKRLLKTIAEVVTALGARHVLVVHSEDGMDEISVSAPTLIYEIDSVNGVSKEIRVAPEDFGIQTAPLDALRIDGVKQSLAMMRSIFSGEHDAASDAVALNAGAALYAAGLGDSIAQGVALAQETIASGQAADKLDQWVAVSREYA